MTPGPHELRSISSSLGEPLRVLLLIVAAYYVAAGLVVQWFRSGRSIWGERGA